MEEMYVRNLVEITKGTLLCGREDQRVEDIETDSRKVKEGDLFVPLLGEKQDGHQYLESALHQCSVAFTMEHQQAESYMQQSGKSVIAVPDTLKAMQQVARQIRQWNPLPIIGVTGSVGKTTTREMIYTALACEKRTFQTIKNYNSQVGVPLTMAKLSRKDEVAVLEMGMSQPGEMERLADMIRPNAAVVTCIGVAHIENLKTQERICDEKLKIATYMGEEDVMFLNGDDPILYARRDSIPQPIVWYGTSDFCDYRATHIRMEGAQTVFEMITPTESFEVRLQAMGEHNVRNALVAVAVAERYGVSAKKAAEALYTFQGQRQKIVHTSRFTMIDDTYNASPDSMRAALRVLRDMPCKGKRIAVLADMLELGEDEVEYHRQVGNYVKEYGIDYLIAYGELSANILLAAGIEGFHATSIEEIEKQLEMVAEPEDVVLLKGSNGMKLSEVTKFFQ